VLTGRNLGIDPLDLKNSWLNISLIVSLFAGSVIKMFLIMLRAAEDI